MIIVALAGRRIDTDGAPVRFPLKQAPSVKGRLTRLLRALQPDALVCSAACGADLLALEAAMALKIPVTIVLPFAPERFRKTSVVDRPGDWGRRYDAVMKRATNGTSADRIHVIEPSSGQDDVYAAATDAILDEAQDLAAKAAASGEESGLVAVVVWEGAARGEGDLTEYFRHSALKRGFTEKVILTRRREPSSGATSRQSRARRKK